MLPFPISRDTGEISPKAAVFARADTQVASICDHSDRTDLACNSWVDLVIMHDYMHVHSYLCTMSLCRSNLRSPVAMSSSDV